MKREPLSSVTNRYCCEDHFDIEKDMINYWECKLGGANPRLKPEVVPHKFACQKSESSLVAERPYAAKKRRLEVIQEAFKWREAQQHSDECIPNTSFQKPDENVEFHEFYGKQSETENKSIQVNIHSHYRSKSTMTSRHCTSKNVALSPIKAKMIDESTSPIKIKSSDYIFSSSDSATLSVSTDESFKADSEEESSNCSFDEQISKETFDGKIRNEHGENDSNEHDDNDEINRNKSPKKDVQSEGQIKPRIPSENDEPNNILCESELTICEETGLFKNKSGQYFNAAHKPIERSEVAAEKATAKIRGENLFKISSIFSIPEGLDICEETGLYKNSKGEYFTTEFGKPLNEQEIDAAKAKVRKKSKVICQISDVCTVDNVIEDENVKTKNSLEKSNHSEEKALAPSDSVINEKVNDFQVMNIKEEPSDMSIEGGRVEFNYIPEDDEETLTSSESASYEHLQGLLDSLDSCESSNLEALKLQSSLRTGTKNDFLNLKETASSIPERDITLKKLLNTQNNLKSKLNKGAGRFKLVRSPDNLPIQPCLLENKTNEEYTPYANRNISYSSKLPITHIVRIGKPARKPRRRKVKIVPVNENEIVNGQKKHDKNNYPDREICVLFTNYSYDGSYINDHDYLVTPYKRNRILIEEKGQSLCMCFICGYKHSINEHVTHMNSHGSKCDICKVSLGTAYMLNLHMRTHSKPCKFCTQSLPYYEIPSHEKKHQEEDLMFEVEKEKKRGREEDRDEDVYFPLPHVENRFTKIPKLRSSSLHVPMQETDGIQVNISHKSDVELDKTGTTDVDTTDVDTTDVDTTDVDTTNVDTTNVDTTNITNAKKEEYNFVKTENESQEPKVPAKRRRRRRTEILSKEESDLEEKLLKINMMSKECSRKRVLRSSFVQRSSESDKAEGSTAKEASPLR
ncbi:hypothetical protein JTB14_001373 [Gonioctena quinquepunctata]|nr:hypothetical protein JTB14_001373 [Gonioctena quinquepunctata]